MRQTDAVIKHLGWGLLCALLSVTLVAAQSSTCPDIVEAAMNAVDELCADTGRNQACYGNVQLSAEPQSGASDFRFESVGDIADLSELSILELSPMDTDAGVWGVALMQVQADIPDTLPGQNVTFILFGDVTIENAAGDDQTPMQAFYLRTGIGDAACDEAPESGLLVQTPDGVEEVSFNVNGTDVQVGSTVLFQAVPDDEMIVTSVEGTAILNFEGEGYPAVAGTRLRLPINAHLLPIGRPELPEAYEEGRFDPLRRPPLPRPIEVAPPLVGTALDNLHGRLREGRPPCGVEGLPPCDALPNFEGRGGAWAAGAQWGLRWVPGENCILPAAAEGLMPDNLPLPICPPAFDSDPCAPRPRMLRDVPIIGNRSCEPPNAERTPPPFPPLPQMP